MGFELLMPTLHRTRRPMQLPGTISIYPYNLEAQAQLIS